MVISKSPHSNAKNLNRGERQVNIEQHKQTDHIQTCINLQVKHIRNPYFNVNYQNIVDEVCEQL